MTRQNPPHPLTRLGLAILGLFLGLVLVEIGLRVLGNPFGYRVRGGEIVLPIRAEYVIRNDTNPKLDPLIVHTKNSLGFRGPEPPAVWEAALTVIAVGGSTTEQFNISDGHTWTELLSERLGSHFPGLWLNNAGFIGHSTYGHQVLLDDVLSRMQPDVVLYLVGANELGLVEIGPYDLAALGDPGSLKGLVKWTTLHSETAALAYNFARTLQTRRLEFDAGYLDLETLPPHPLTPEEIAAILAEFEGEPLASYRDRLTRLVVATRAAGIEPVLLTQPALFGDVIDPTTGVDLGLVDFHDRNGAVEWRILELYNDVTREVAEAEAVFLADLAVLMPKDSQYFRDMIHYTNSGSELVASILHPALCEHLASRFSPAVKPCPATQ